MNATFVPLEPEQKGILWACLEYWKTEPLPIEQCAICFSWIEGIYRSRFGRTFHQSKLAGLAALGYLIADDTSRGGNRRYYRLADPAAIEGMLRV